MLTAHAMIELLPIFQKRVMQVLDKVFCQASLSAMQYTALRHLSYKGYLGGLDEVQGRCFHIVGSGPHILLQLLNPWWGCRCLLWQSLHCMIKISSAFLVPTFM